METINDKLYRTWFESKEEPTEEFFLVVKDLSETVGNKYHPNVNDLEDLIYGATLYVIETRDKLELDKTKPAYSYLVTVIKSYMVSVLNKRRKYGTSV